MAAPVVEAFSFDGNGATNSTTLNILKPSGTAEGDLLVAIIVSSDTDTTRTLNVPSGWSNETLYYVTNGAANVLQGWVYKVAGASEPTSYDFTITGASARLEGIIYRISGADTTTPIGGNSVAYEGTFNTLLYTPQITLAESDSLLIASVAGYFDGFAGDPTGLTVDLGVGDDAGGTAIELGSGHVANYPAGSSAIYTWSRSGDGRNIGLAIEVLAATAVNPDVSIVINLENRTVSRIEL